jgi:hypothetical protein
VPKSPLKLLVIADLRQSPAAMLSDSVEAICRWSRHQVTLVRAGMPRIASGDVDGFDAVLIHYSVFVEQERHLGPAARLALSRSRAAKVVWQQDEHRNVSGLARAFTDLQASLALTCLPISEADRVYGPYLGHQMSFLSVYTGYVSDRLLAETAPPYVSRPIAVGYRGRTYPLWHGRLGRERLRIAREVQAWAGSRGLSTDISTRERDRLYGPFWTEFLHSCKATLATESGASAFDPDGSFPEKVWRFVLRHPLASEKEIAAATYGSFEDRVDYAQISPRVFEAIAGGSLLLLSPGRYSGLVEIGRHAVAVEPGGRNAEEIVDLIRDPPRAARIIETARAEILLRPDLHEKAFVQRLDDAIEDTVEERCVRSEIAKPSLPSADLIADRNPKPARRVLGRLASALFHATSEKLPNRLGRYFEALLRVAVLQLRRSIRGVDRA